jgi:hypothetical protein
MPVQISSCMLVKTKERKEPLKFLYASSKSPNSQTQTQDNLNPKLTLDFSKPKTSIRTISLLLHFFLFSLLLPNLLLTLSPSNTSIASFALKMRVHGIAASILAIRLMGAAVPEAFGGILKTAVIVFGAVMGGFSLASHCCGCLNV